MNRSTLRPRRPLVLHDPPPRWLSPQVHRRRGHLPHPHLRRLDLRHIHRRPRLARHLHDLISCCYSALDHRLCHAVTAKPQGDQVQEVCGIRVLRNFGPIDLVLHSAQGAQGAWRCVVSTSLSSPSCSSYMRLTNICNSIHHLRLLRMDARPPRRRLRRMHRLRLRELRDRGQGRQGHHSRVRSLATQMMGQQAPFPCTETSQYSHYKIQRTIF